MRDIHFEELISAYVDGELSGDERMLVERELRESQASQRLYEQLLSQRQLLATLPRFTAPADLADRVMRSLESQMPAPASAESRDVRQNSRNRGRRLSVNILLGLATAVAAGLMLTVLLRDERVDRPLQPQKQDLAIKKVDPTLRFAAFRERFSLLCVYDLSITPSGRERKILDQWLQAANIQIERTVAIENQLEEGVLESRFIGDEKIVAKDQGPEAKDEVEMILVRGTAGQVDAILREWHKIRGRDQDQVSVRMDMVMSPKELEIFLRLNDAIDGEKAMGEVVSSSWTTPGAFRLTSNTPLQTSVKAELKPAVNALLPVSRGLGSASLGILMAANQDQTVDQAAASSQGEANAVLPPMGIANVIGADVPSQALIIVRNLKKDVVFPAVRGPAFK